MTRAAGTQAAAAAIRAPLAGVLDLARRRLRRTIIVVAAAWILTFAFAQEILVLLAQPLTHAWENHRAELGAPSLHFSALVEPFWVYMTLAFWIGLFVSSPFLFHQLWSALTRLRRPSRRSMATPFAAATTLCFAVGAAFCYFVVLPLAFDFFLGYATRNLAHMSSSLGFDVELGKPMALRPALYLEPYLALTIRMLVAFGLVFELPIVILFLSSIGLVTHRTMWRFNRWAIVLAFVIAAILTPGPDIVSQVAMAVPLVVLYNLSILIALVMTRRREKATADAS